MSSKLLTVTLVTYVALTIVGVAMYLGRETEVPFTPARVVGDEAPTPPFLRGVQVRASSWDWRNQHHVMYAIDGEERPTSLEKWASHIDDRRPWLEVRTASGAPVSAVTIVHAGSFESEDFTMRDYDIRCVFEGDRTSTVLEVRGNLSNRATHELACDNALGVRLDFGVESDLNHPRSVARVYEVQIEVGGSTNTEGNATTSRQSQASGDEVNP